jgi:hypothetical protein
MGEKMFCHNCGAQRRSTFSVRIAERLLEHQRSHTPPAELFCTATGYIHHNITKRTPAQSPQRRKKRPDCLNNCPCFGSHLIVAAIINGGEISFSTANISEAYMRHLLTKHIGTS